MKKKIFLGFLFVLIGSAFLILKYYPCTILPSGAYTNDDFNIRTYVSSVDKDQDGIDDQTDILRNAQAYVATRPAYKSIYYASGYPNDEHGVCTDVVGFVLLRAGYDLMQLVDEDIRSNPALYGIEKPDPLIDFRRVRNLKVYFDCHAKSLTKDIYDIGEWQGGDIVIFKEHIGIISDKRNRKGVPFLIHHAIVGQPRYEENILEAWQPVLGHYRIS